MKTKIKVKVITEGCMPTISDNGDWIDLRSSVDYTFAPAQADVLRKIKVGNKELSYRNVTMPVVTIPLGVAIELPEGYEAIVANRSSCATRLHLMNPNGIGIIDNSYNGDSDEWKYCCSPTNSTSIKAGDRVCQFRVQLSQKATLWQKIKWLFSSGVELVEVEHLGNDERGGFGSTGIN